MKFGGNMRNAMLYMPDLEFSRLNHASVWFGEKGVKRFFECPDSWVRDTEKLIKHDMLLEHQETFVVKAKFFSEQFFYKFFDAER